MRTGVIFFAINKNKQNHLGYIKTEVIYMPNSNSANDYSKDRRKIRRVNEKFYDLPPKEREIIMNTMSGHAFEMSRSDENKQGNLST